MSNRVYIITEEQKLALLGELELEKFKTPDQFALTDETEKGATRCRRVHASPVSLSRLPHPQLRRTKDVMPKTPKTRFYTAEVVPPERRKEANADFLIHIPVAEVPDAIARLASQLKGTARTATLRFWQVKLTRV